MSGHDAAGTPHSGGLVLLGGPPGSGKSTVAEKLASAAERPTVHMHTDTFYVWIRSGFVPPYLPEDQQQNAVVQNVMIDAACAYAGGYDVILDGILGPWMLEPFRAACRQRGLDLSYIVLRPSLDVALARGTRREGRHLNDIEPITGPYGAFADLGALENHVVDSSAQSVEQTTAEIAAGLRAGTFVVGPVGP
ncbi:AAA family ATPase [Streptomyces sp. NPDC059649]|uniref:AAA family ATPase n=1 Tax=Streptomyces sp. NPDC059649 TaxID=3346895 RepID=UPI0036BD2215